MKLHTAKGTLNNKLLFCVFRSSQQLQLFFFLSVLSFVFKPAPGPPTSGSHSFGFGHVVPIFLAGVHWPARRDISKGWGGEATTLDLLWTWEPLQHIPSEQLAGTHIPAA